MWNADDIRAGVRSIVVRTFVDDQRL